MLLARLRCPGSSQSSLFKLSCKHALPVITGLLDWLCAFLLLLRYHVCCNENEALLTEGWRHTRWLQETLARRIILVLSASMSKQSPHLSEPRFL